MAVLRTQSTTPCYRRPGPPRLAAPTRLPIAMLRTSCREFAIPLSTLKTLGKPSSGSGVGAAEKSPPASECIAPTAHASCASEPANVAHFDAMSTPDGGKPVYPTHSADQLFLGGVQVPGGVPARGAPAPGRHTTPFRLRPLPPRDERPLTHVLS